MKNSIICLLLILLSYLLLYVKKLEAQKSNLMEIVSAMTVDTRDIRVNK